jgi:preprotein translocase subunit SecB
VANIVSKGGFPEFLLQPINFDALYAQGMAQAQAKSQEQPATAGSNGGGNGGSA